jgi:hypothetical protein
MSGLTSSPELRRPGNEAQPARRRWVVPAALAFVAMLIAIGVVPRLARRSEAQSLAQASETGVPVVSVVRATPAPPISELLLPGNKPVLELRTSESSKAL